jgi:hypothetical protein
MPNPLHPAACLASAALVCLAASSELRIHAQDDTGSKPRMALMQATIEAFVPSTETASLRANLAFADKPLLRYSDPTRGLTDENVLLDATVWRLGRRGRPLGLVTLEIYRSTAEQGILAYEFASLSEARFTIERTGRADARPIAWDATGSALTVKRLEGGPPPAKSAPGRLTQMRTLARRFSVHETVNDTVIECRLLSQPIDRYDSAAEEIDDGALFAFANGTNPEVGLALETGKDGWTYGLVRLSAAASTVKLDEREVARYEKVDNVQRAGSYTSTIEKIELPK